MKRANFVLTALVYTFICLLAATSCSNDPQELYENPEPGAPEKEYAPQEFAKRLACALQNTALRHFIQQEAALQKDGDYDILLAGAIDKETGNGLLKSGAETAPSLRDYLKGAALRSAPPASRGSLTDEPRYTDYIRKAKFRDNKAIRDYESWLNGRPEVCCEVVFSASSDATARTIAYGNKGWWNGAVYECNTPIVQWNYATHGYYIAYHWYESDGGSAATTVIDLPSFLSPEGFLIPGGSVTISHCKMDDPIGTTFVDYAGANEQAFDPTGTGKFTWWCAYR